MGISNLEIEKHLVEHQILKANMVNVFNGEYIRLDGDSVTIADIPFALGLSIPTLFTLGAGISEPLQFYYPLGLEFVTDAGKSLRFIGIGGPVAGGDIVMNACGKTLGGGKAGDLQLWGGFGTGGGNDGMVMVGSDDERDFDSSTITRKSLGVAENFEVLGNSLFGGTVIVGADTDGHDVRVYGETTGNFMLWDASADQLVLNVTNTTAIDVSVDYTGGAANESAMIFGVINNSTASKIAFTANANATSSGTVRGGLFITAITGSGSAGGTSIEVLAGSASASRTAKLNCIGSPSLSILQGVGDFSFISQTGSWIDIGGNDITYLDFLSSITCLQDFKGIYFNNILSDGTGTGDLDIFKVDVTHSNWNGGGTKRILNFVTDIDSFMAGDLGFGQTDLAERIGSDADGTLDLYAGTSIDLHQATTVGADTDGHDVQFFGATTGKYWLWDESIDAMIVVGDSALFGTLSLGIDDFGYNAIFYGDTSGKFMLWDSSADELQITGTTLLTGAAVSTGGLTMNSALECNDIIVVGVNGTGHDVTFYGATTGKSFFWDEGNDKLVITGDLEVNGVSKLGDGGTTNYTEFSVTGDQTFVGSAGLPHGTMGQENIPTTVTIITAGVPVIVDGMTGGETNNVTFQNSQELKVLKAGKYFISWSVSFNMVSGSGQEVEGTIGKNGTSQSIGSAHRKIGTGNDTGNMCGSTIMDLAINDLVTIMVANESTTVNVVIAHASFSLIQVGGT